MKKAICWTIEETVQKNFKIECVKRGVNMNEVVQELMEKFINGEIVIGGVSIDGSLQNN